MASAWTRMQRRAQRTSRKRDQVGRSMAIAQDAIDRLQRARLRGTGCHLTAEMVASLGLTLLGEIMSEPRPANPKAPQ